MSPFTFDLLGIAVTVTYDFVEIENMVVGSNIFIHFASGNQQALMIKEMTSTFTPKTIQDMKEAFPSAWRSALRNLCQYHFSFSASSESFGSQVYTFMSSTAE